ncbi:hypothetical protein QUF70_07710 [Desulfobacterales bacterium HSG17]|nr:hypothetical protein [Desulfobacterales bacterium HSG17]
MAIDITGITNENEFYTHHYLSAILENDLKDVFSKWKQQEADHGVLQPFVKLRSLRKNFFVKQRLLEKERQADRRLNIQKELTAQILDALGYEYQPVLIDLDNNYSIPLAGEIKKGDGSPELWIIEVFDLEADYANPLELRFCRDWYLAVDEIDKVDKIPDLPVEEIVSRYIFAGTEPPRWVILVSSTQMLLIDRSKWHEKRLLRFNIREILDRGETSTLQAAAALLHRDSICPKDGLPLLDTLDENSHKHAFAVSEDLKYSLRKAIELLGNEAVYYLRETLHEKIYGRDMAGQLSRECLRYMYRLLFLFYIEARPELGYLPDKSEEFRKGYSLESLRDLEIVKLTTEESKNGFYIHKSVKILFDLLYRGFDLQQMDIMAKPDFNTFRISPLRSHLFDPKQTPILNKVKFRNHVLQNIIELMSLTRTKKGKNSRRGRISYSQLGIHQLGAVYEALLSYQGFFAETELYEVKKAGTQHNELDTAYFVKSQALEQYNEDERVFNDDGTLVKYERGTFIYRLAGRDREKSASYYTPEVLTQCLVKYALKELIKDKTADEILNLTVCEPAMGSAAFLNEAVNQLAKAYLNLKQKETGEAVSHDKYSSELQKVKMYIADNNVFGVDLNPVAVELAEVSLWLNTIYQGAFVPWFGMQLVCGNSLVGARRQVFHKNLLKKKKKGEPFWQDEIPQRVMPGEKRAKGCVYHFLLPDKNMAKYKDKVIKKMAADQIKKIDEWQRDFIKPFSKFGIEQLETLSDAADKLWKSHAQMQRDIWKRTTDPLFVFGQAKPKTKMVFSTTEEKDRIFHQEMFSKDVRNSSPYRRLKLVMDYWCALWFWPIEKADLLPSQAEFLLDLTLVLEGNFFDTGEVKEQIPIFPDTRPEQMSVDMMDEFGFVNVDKLCRDNERFKLVKELGERYRFLHWELEFADLFERNGGFDLVLGNPPWIKVEWNEGGVLGDAEPLFVLRKMSASALAEKRSEALEKYGLTGTYLSAFEDADGTQNFLNGLQNYPLLKGMQTNLYKCFLPQAWMIGKQDEGVSGFLHPEGIYDDPKGGAFRQEVYPRLRDHFQFQNELNLFAEVDHHAKFSINIFSNFTENQVSFSHLANLYAPSTIDKSFEHAGFGIVPGIKNDDNKWNIKGHNERIINCTIEELALFAKLYDAEGTPPLAARLPAVHSRQIVEVLRKFAAQPKRLGDLQGEYYSTVMWDETNAVKKTHTIKRQTCFPKDTSQWILSGPHFFVGNPFYKTPRVKCTLNSHYDILDLTTLPDDYLPRTNYVPDCDAAEYRKRTPKFRTTNGDLVVTDGYQLVNRRMLSQSGERTFITVIIPKHTATINTCVLTAFSSTHDLIQFYGCTLSIIYDFFLKSTGRADCYANTLLRFPLLKIKAISIRALFLTCLTIHYSDLWQDCFQEAFCSDTWAKPDPRLPNTFFTTLTPKWNRDCALRTDFSRRQALVEIDVLAAMALGLTLDELKTIYRVQFPVMRQNESDTWYDRNGRIVFTCSKGLTGVGFTRPEWNNIKDMQTGTVDRTITDDTLPGGPVERTITYEAPFDCCDREKDYEVVWVEFERRFNR